MRIKVNITREYLVETPFDQTFSHLDQIVSTSFNNSQYSMFGNFVSSDPPEFVFMAKWNSIGKPFTPFISTRVYAKLFRNGINSKIAVTTKSNPAIILFLIISVLAILVKLITYNTPEDLKSVAIYILVAIGILLLDRFLKNIVISSFETDMKIKR
jgi:hypothetical protein